MEIWLGCENTTSGEKMCDPHADRHSICAECSVRSFENLCTCVDQPKRYPMCELLHVGR